MRKLLTTISFLAITGFFVASCNKRANWECTCTKDGDIVYQTTTLYDAKKKTEKIACEKMEQEIEGAKCKLRKK